MISIRILAVGLPMRRCLVQLNVYENVWAVSSVPTPLVIGIGVVYRVITEAKLDNCSKY